MMSRIDDTERDDPLAEWGAELAAFDAVPFDFRLRVRRVAVESGLPDFDGESQRQVLAERIAGALFQASGASAATSFALLLYQPGWQYDGAVLRRRGLPRMLAQAEDYGRFSNHLEAADAYLAISSSGSRWFATVPVSQPELPSALRLIAAGRAVGVVDDDAASARALGERLTLGDNGEWRSRPMLLTFACRQADAGASTLLARDYNDDSGRVAYILMPR
jgi:hypothetical protein